jgi:hypothetical protein
MSCKTGMRNPNKKGNAQIKNKSHLYFPESGIGPIGLLRDDSENPFFLLEYLSVISNKNIAMNKKEDNTKAE